MAITVLFPIRCFLENMQEDNNNKKKKKSKIDTFHKWTICKNVDFYTYLLFFLNFGFHTNYI